MSGSNDLRRRLTGLAHPEWWLDVLAGTFLNPSEAVLVTGFWRSGTTWLLQSFSKALRAKAVFEPFHYGIGRYRRSLRESCLLPNTSDEYLNMYMPHLGGEFSTSNSLISFTEAALTGRITHPWVRSSRIANRMERGGTSDWRILETVHRMRDSMRTRVVTKFVRAHLLVPALQHSFNPVIIHVRRDPRAIVASFERLDWTWYRSLSVEEQLLSPEDGRAEYFESWTDDIRRYDREEPLIRVAAYWALLERFIDDLEKHPRRVVLSYEDLCLHPERELREHVAPLIPAIPSREQLEVPSETDRDHHSASMKERVHGWKDELHNGTVKKIDEVVSSIEKK